MTQGPYDVRRCICECDPLSPAKKKKRDCAPKKKMNEAMAKLSHEKEKKKKKKKKINNLKKQFSPHLISQPRQPHLLLTTVRRSFIRKK